MGGGRGDRIRTEGLDGSGGDGNTPLVLEWPRVDRVGREPWHNNARTSTRSWTLNRAATVARNASKPATCGCTCACARAAATLGVATARRIGMPRKKYVGAGR